MPRINDAGLALVQAFEGFRAEAYRCPAGVWTIGYGHTVEVAEGDRITLEDAEVLLRSDLARSEAAVDRLVTVPLSDNQFSALVSFCFNLGEGNLASSTLLRKLNAGNYDAVPSQLARWVKGGGRTLPGLVRRRAAEAALWATPDGDEDDDGMAQAVEAVEVPKALSRSRTLKAAGAVGVAGLAGLVEPVQALLTVLEENRGALESGDMVSIAVGLIAVIGAASIAWNRVQAWRDAA